jgi:hypothetical protein
MKKIDKDDLRSRCQLLCRLARAHLYLGDSESSRKCQSEGVGLAQLLGDKASLFDLHVLPFLNATAIISASEAGLTTARVDELKRLSETINDDDARSRALSLDVYVSTELGLRARAEAAVDGLERLAKLRQRQHVMWLSRHARAMLAILDGRFEAAEAFAEEALSLEDRPTGLRSTVCTECKCLQSAASRTDSPRWHRL